MPGTSVLMGRGASSSDKELASSILAGEMKNAWQVEDRPKQPDTRPASMRQGGWNARNDSYRDNYDKVFKK